MCHSIWAVRQHPGATNAHKKPAADCNFNFQICNGASQNNFHTALICFLTLYCGTKQHLWPLATNSKLLILHLTTHSTFFPGFCRLHGEGPAGSSYPSVTAPMARLRLAQWQSARPRCFTFPNLREKDAVVLAEIQGCPGSWDRCSEPPPDPVGPVQLHRFSQQHGTDSLVLFSFPPARLLVLRRCRGQAYELHLHAVAYTDTALELLRSQRQAAGARGSCELERSLKGRPSLWHSRRAAGQQLGRHSRAVCSRAVTCTSH